LAKSLSIDGLCAGANDFSALTCSYVAQNLGLPGHDSYEICRTIHIKDEYRAFAKQHGIRSPNAWGYSSLEDAIKGLELLSYPLIVKPVDLTGGKGVGVATTIAEGRVAIAEAFNKTRAGRIVIESYLSGTHHGLTTFIRNQEVVFYFVDNEHYYKNLFMVSGASTPSSVSDEVVGLVCRDAQKIAKSLNLVDGILHIQFIRTSDGPVILEICRRAPGDLYIKLVEVATGLDYPELIVRSAVGDDCKDAQHLRPNACYLRHCIMANHNGVVSTVELDPWVRSRVHFQNIWGGSDYLVKNYLTEKLGILIIKFKSAEELEYFLSCHENLINIDFKSSSPQ
jgi:biotin carboxylase